MIKKSTMKACIFFIIPLDKCLLKLCFILSSCNENYFYGQKFNESLQNTHN